MGADRDDGADEYEQHEVGAMAPASAIFESMISPAMKSSKPLCRIAADIVWTAASVPSVRNIVTPVTSTPSKRAMTACPASW